MADLLDKEEECSCRLFDKEEDCPSSSKKERRMTMASFLLPWRVVEVVMSCFKKRFKHFEGGGCQIS